MIQVFISTLSSMAVEVGTSYTPTSRTPACGE